LLLIIHLLIRNSLKKQVKPSIRGNEKPKNTTGMLPSFTNGFFCKREKGFLQESQAT